MHAVWTNQIADILHFNDNDTYFTLSPYFFAKLLCLRLREKLQNMRQ